LESCADELARLLTAEAAPPDQEEEDHARVDGQW
jgi:hypothetical protein